MFKFNTCTLLIIVHWWDYIHVFMLLVVLLRTVSLTTNILETFRRHFISLTFYLLQKYFLIILFQNSFIFIFTFSESKTEERTKKKLPIIIIIPFPLFFFVKLRKFYFLKHSLINTNIHKICCIFVLSYSVWSLCSNQLFCFQFKYLQAIITSLRAYLL